MRNISFALTTEQFLAGTKTVTRRVGWEHLKAGDMLCAVRKSQGLKKGEQVERLGVIRIRSVRRERLSCMTQDEVYGKRECVREGFPDLAPAQFVEFFCKSHKGTWRESLVTRIQFERFSLSDEEWYPSAIVVGAFPGDVIYRAMAVMCREWAKHDRRVQRFRLHPTTEERFARHCEAILGYEPVRHPTLAYLEWNFGFGPVRFVSDESADPTVIQAE